MGEIETRKMNILIVEDDQSINDLIYDGLRKHGYGCTQAYSGTEGLLLFQNNEIDLVITDLMMPGMSGEELIRKIRTDSSVPAIVVSAKDTIDSKVDLLSMGADDYLTKPFEVKELVARVEATFRRCISLSKNDKDSDSSHEILVHKGLQMDLTSYEVTIDGKDLGLTRQETKILELFLRRPTKLFTKQEIYEYAWNEPYLESDKTINVHMSNIRMKISDITQDDYIETVWGVGFKLSK